MSIEGEWVGPPTQCDAIDLWNKLRIACEWAHYFLYVKGNIDGALRYKNIIAETIIKLPFSGDAIILFEAKALLSEMSGDFSSAILYREKEVELIERLHDSIGSDTKLDLKKALLRRRCFPDLKRRKLIMKSLSDQMEGRK